MPTVEEFATFSGTVTVWRFFAAGTLFVRNRSGLSAAFTDI